MSMLKSWKVWMLIILVVLSIIALAPNPWAKGIVVAGKDSNSPIPLNISDKIYTINDQPATLESIQQPYAGIIKLGTSRGDLIVQVNGSLGLIGKNAPTSNLRFGLDLEGGIRVVLKLNSTENSTVEQTISTLQTRINLFGLREANLRSVRESGNAFVEISLAGGSSQEIEELLERQGKFDARIPIVLNFVSDNSTKTLTFDKEYTVAKASNGIVVNGDIINISQNVKLGDIELVLTNLTDKQAILSAQVFTGSDIKFVFTDSQRSGIQPAGRNAYRWSFQVQLSDIASKRFGMITKNLQVTGSSLSSPLQLYLDNEIVDELSIEASLRGRDDVREPSVTGTAPSKEDAINNQRRLQAILRSGSLPTEVEIVQLEVISPNLGGNFLQSILLSIVAAVLAVSAVIAVRYRKIKVVIPILIISFSEIIIIFGASVLIGWTIDLASIAGIIAIIGTGIDAQIIMVDQATRKEDERIIGFRERLNQAVFMILGAGGTVIGAMLPLFAFGLGVLRGFALTTIIGVLLGILVTRPAFGEIIKKIVD